MRQEETLQETKIRALIVDPNSGTPVLILKDLDSDDMVPIWVGACEANAIAAALENNLPPRPMTHDLLRNLVTHLGLRVVRVVITALRENTYYANIELLDGKEELVTLDARPSDAIALALRAACPIMVSRQIFEEQMRRTESESKTSGALSEEWPDVITESGEGS